MWIKTSEPCKGMKFMHPPIDFNGTNIGDVGPRGSFRIYLLPRTEQCVLVRDTRFWAVRILDRIRAPRSLHANTMRCQVGGAGPREMFRSPVSFRTAHRVSPRRPAAVLVRTHAARNDQRALEQIWPGWVANATDRDPARNSKPLQAITPRPSIRLQNSFTNQRFGGRCRSADLLLQSGAREPHPLQDSCFPAPTN